MSVANRFDRRLVIAWISVFLGVVGFFTLRQAIRAEVIPGKLVTGVLFGSDSAAYSAAARAPIWSKEFLAAPGPFGFLLVAKLALRNVRAVIVVQGTVWAAAWLLLARVVTTRLSTRAARALAWIALLMMGMAPELLQWVAAYSTESLSMSALVITLALAIRLVEAPTTARASQLAGAVAALVFLRDTNAIIVAGVGTVCLVVALVRPQLRSVALILGATGLATALVATALSNDAHRWYYPLQETVVRRVQLDESGHRYLAAHGFPESPAVAALGDPLVYLGAASRIDRAPEYAELRRWLERDGRRVYSTFLLTHPRYVLSLPWHNRQALLAPHVVPLASARIAPPRFDAVVSWPGYPTSYRLIEVWLLFAIVGGAVVFVRGRDPSAQRWIVIGTVTLVLWVPHALLAFHGDALENDRHELTAAVQLRLALWLITFAIVDVFVVTVARRRAHRQIPSRA